MAEISWIKLDIRIFDNRKIKQIRSMPDGNSILIVWLQLLCLAGNINDQGKIYLTEEVPYTDQMLATAFGENISLIQLALKTFQMFNMIDIEDDVIYVLNWEKYQAIEQMEKIREQNRIRKQRERERKKLLIEECHADVTQCHAIEGDKEEDKDKDINKKNVKKKKAFTPPTFEEVEEYVKSRGNKINAKKFFDYYEASGWKKADGKPVMNWKQKAIGWEDTQTTQASQSNKRPDFLMNKPEPTISQEERKRKQEEASEWYKQMEQMMEEEDGN